MIFDDNDDDNDDFDADDYAGQPDRYWKAEVCCPTLVSTMIMSLFADRRILTIWSLQSSLSFDDSDWYYDDDDDDNDAADYAGSELVLPCSSLILKSKSAYLNQFYTVIVI